MATLFELDEPKPTELVLERFAVLYDAGSFQFGGREVEPDWQLDTDTICETREAAEQLMDEWHDGGSWRIVPVKIVAQLSLPLS